MSVRARLVIDELNRHRFQFEHFVRSLTNAELATVVPGTHWLVRDYVAHLCTIDGLIVSGLARRVGISVPQTDVPRAVPFDIDDWNDSAIQSRRGCSSDELLVEGAAHREDLLTVIARLTDAEFDRDVRVGGDRKAINLPVMRATFSGTVWAIAIHDTTHAEDMLRALPERRKELWLSEWLTSVNDARIPESVRAWRA